MKFAILGCVAAVALAGCAGSSTNPDGTPREQPGEYTNSPLYQDEQPFAYNEPIVDDWYDSGYEESLSSPFSMN